jgi:hypothetical protein
MRSTAFAALLLAACGTLCARSLPGPAGNIGVFFTFGDKPSPTMMTAIRNELDAIMRPLGLSFAWREIGQDEYGAIFPDLVVVRFNGPCGRMPEYSAPKARGDSDIVLASTETEEGQILHFTTVNCDAVDRYLAFEVAGMSEKDREETYGRALGRILAHEMYHVFANRETHARAGIARASYSREDLLRPVFRFEPEESALLRDYANRRLR